MIRVPSYFVLTVLFLSAILGCDNASTPGNNVTGDNGSKAVPEKENIAAVPLVAADKIQSALAAKKVLEESIAAYRTITTYEDSGSLKLRVPLQENPIDDSEPMRIAYEAPNKLAIRALDLQSCWKSTTFESIVRGSDVSPFGKQRLVRPRPEKLDLTWLILDHLDNSLDNPSTRTPIQLQMLFDKNALSGFRNERAELSLLSPEMFDSRKCDRVRVVLEKLQWTLWIDSESRLIRKYVLPVELIEAFLPNLPADLDRSKMEIAVELSGAQQGHKIEWTDWQLPDEPDAILVRRFIQPPFQLPALLGETIAPFDLKSATGDLLLDSSARTKPITILCWVATDDLSELLIKDLMELDRQLNSLMPKNSFEIVLVSKAPAPQIKESLKKWNCDFPLAIDVDDVTGKIFKVQDKLSIVVLDKRSTVQYVNEYGYLAVLPTLLRELFDDVDPAARARLQSIHDQSRFTSRLHRAILERAQTEQLPNIEQFPFTFHPAEVVWNVPFEAPLVAAGGEQHYQKQNAAAGALDPFAKPDAPARVMTVLDELGNVYAIDSLGQSKRVSFIPIEKATEAARIHILPDPWDHDRVAIIPEGLPRFWIVNSTQIGDKEPMEATEYELGPDESSIASVWTALGDQVSFVIATNKNRLVAYDPATQKLSASESKGAIAIIPALNAKGECVDWNACDALGKLTPISRLPSSVPPTNPVIDQLAFRPLRGNWTWGNGRQGPVTLAMADLASGEAGTILQYHNKNLSSSTHPLSVRAEQCRILSSTQIKEGAFYWLSTAPRLVLHLQTNDNFYRDQMSFGKPILGACLFPFESDLKMLVALDNSVSCWNVKIPPSPIPLGSGASQPTTDAAGAESSGNKGAASD